MNQKLKYIIAFLASCLLMFGGVSYVYAAGTLSVAVSSDTVKTGDTVTVTIYAANADQEKVTADLSVTYDTSLLEYVSSSDTNATYGNGKVSAKGESVSIKFKAVASGDAYVKAEAATLTAGGTHITVTGSAASQDTSDDGGSTVKSGDNSLSSLTISPGTLSPAFKGSVTEYTAEVGGDVNEINVTPVTSNSKAVVESVSGNKDLKSGKNVITVLVKAENGTEASYKITVTKGDTVSTSAQGADASATSSDTPQEGDIPAETDASDASGDAIVVDGVSYKISEEFTDEEIPEGFSRADFEYKGKPYKGISFDHGHLGMYYLSNESGESSFFVYDADRDKFYPYVRLSSGDHYIILMVVPNGAIPPDNYKEATVSIGEMATVSAYQFAGAADKEIVKFDNPEEEAAYNTESDFYLFYGMDETGTSGWYQYDAKQGTYQRFNQDAIIPADTGQNYEMLLKSYNELSERYDDVRARDRRLIGILIFSAVVLLIFIINLLLKVRELKREDESAFYEEEKPRKNKPKTKSRQKAPAKEISRADDREPETGFYDADDRDIIDEFEEDPEILSSRRKKEREVRMQRMGQADAGSARKRTRVSDDDDIEFLDLN
ncbi:MAG: hypothetical protein HFJ05_00740 [Eubacterium sp.]|nr:hypothetical protein [Eubacterium sp.]